MTRKVVPEDPRESVIRRLNEATKDANAAGRSLDLKMAACRQLILSFEERCGEAIGLCALSAQEIAVAVINEEGAKIIAANQLVGWLSGFGMAVWSWALLTAMSRAL